MIIELNGLVGGENFSLAYIQQQIKAKNPSELELVISSPGGDAFEGLGMYDYLKSLDIPIKTIAFGLVASAAAVVFTAGSERIAFEGTSIMVHNSWTNVKGNKKELLKEAETLSLLDERMINCYRKAGIDISNSNFLQAVENDKFLSAEQAKEFNLVTQVNMSIKLLLNQAKKAFLNPKAMAPIEVESEGVKYFIISESGSPTVGDQVTLETGEPVPNKTMTVDSGSMAGTTVKTDENGFIAEITEPSAGTENPTPEAMEDDKKEYEAEVAQVIQAANAMAIKAGKFEAELKVISDKLAKVEASLKEKETELVQARKMLALNANLSKPPVEAKAKESDKQEAKSTYGFLQNSAYQNLINTLNNK